MTAAPDALTPPPDTPGTLAVEMHGIVKRFPGVVANDGVDFDLRAGEVHALLGENGAGKSTLMNVLDGLYRPDAGEIRVFGAPVELRSPRDAIAAGIGMVHQHFALVPTQTVTENVLIGLDRPRFRVDLGRFDDEVAELAGRHGLAVDPRARIWQLSVGEQQRVEILKMLYRGARILILDEPTAVLAPQEAADLFATLRGMVAAGTSVVFISHKLAEVTRISDRVTVMRRGKVTAAGVATAGTTTAGLAQLMVGREVVESIERSPFAPGPVVLAMRDVEADSDRGLPALRGVSLDVRAGEILGVAGRRGQRPVRARAGPDGTSSMHRRVRHDERRRGRQPHPAGGDQPSDRPRARGPDRRRERPRPLGRRQPDHEELPGRPHRAPLVDRHGRGPAVRRPPPRCLLDRRAVGRHGGAPAVGRQPPAPDPGPRDRLTAAADGGGPAHPRAWTSARSRRCTACCSSSGRPGRPRS